MASADLSQELECPVCLTIYTDPVILRCGHNFCRVCIDRVLDTQEGSGCYSCPECRAQYMERPTLQRNIALRKIAESFQSTQPDQEEAGVCCTYCVDCSIPAVKSCLLCEASLCSKHLRVHSKAPEHILCDPNTSLENRKCSVHKKILEYYCTEDAACICVSCRLDGEHRGHQVEILDEASEKKKKKLRNDLKKLMAGTEEAEKRVPSLEERRRKAQEKADGETVRVTALFRDLRRRLEKLEERVLSDIIRQAEQVSQSYNDVIQQLKIKKEELSRKMHHIEELCNMTDPLTILQESDTGDLCDTEDRERHDKQLHDGGDLDVAGISHTLHTGLADIMSGVIVLKHTDIQAYPHSSTEDKVPITAELSRPRPQPTSTTQHTQRQAGGTDIGAAQQTSGLPVYADILLDENTAGNDLHISDDRKIVSSSPVRQHRSEIPGRFNHCPQVLSIQSFSSGQHCWEVDVGGSVWCRVGMCYPSIDRRQKPVIGNNNKSWCLEKKDNQYSIIHDQEVIQPPDKVPSSRVRIDLDYEAGQISFYALCDPIRHLHTFTAAFTEPLHAALWVWEGSIKIRDVKGPHTNGFLADLIGAFAKGLAKGIDKSNDNFRERSTKKWSPYQGRHFYK
ncbi:E3 ubiquitin/ISG15 ligase TRIM25-like [Hyperolius riggenbachi]|uniref:E3 ubiquitin/ISG15 ligase TRIM25-like n=1 Tax=Hyperolius riggenbachi TaxID=752182 RepID=UPI0035A295D8